MDDKKKPFVIMFIVFFVMMYLQIMFPAQPASVPPVTTNGTATAPVGAANPTSPGMMTGAMTSPAVTTVGGNPPANVPSLKQFDESPQTLINTGVALFTINHLGGRVQSVSLKTHTAEVNSSEPLQLISRKEGSPLPLGIFADGTTDDFTLYQLSPENLPTMEGQYYNVSDTPATFIFKGELPTGLKVEKKLTFKKGSYAVETTIAFDRPVSNAEPMRLQWTHPATPEKVAAEGPARKVSILSAENKLSSTVFSSMKDVSMVGAQTALFTPVPAHWISVCDYYFIEAIINPAAPALVREQRVGDTYFIETTGSTTGGNFVFYTGPKDSDSLHAVGYALDRSVDLGMFSFLAHPILAAIRFLHGFIGNYGLSIILLTLLIKLGFLPLTQTSFKSMKAMQELQPEIAALRERVTDPTILNQELMGLYKKRGVNPLGGCFPMLIQIPVFLGLYNALLNSIELRHEPFALWINDLSSPEKLHVFGIGIPLMIILMGASMFVQQLTQPSTMDPQQKKIMMFMPVIFTGMFILHPMPSGLVLYWLTNNMISIVQQYSIRESRRVTPLQATAYASLAIFLFGFLLTKI